MANTNAVLPNTLNLPQPDFDLIEQGAHELGKLRNLPAFSQGQAILDAINQLGTHFTTQFGQLNTQVTQLSTQVNQVNTQLTQLDARVTQLDARVTQLDARVTQLSTQINQVNTQLTQLTTRVTQNHNIATQNHNNATQQIANLNQNMTQGFADLRTSLAATEHNSVARVTNSHVNRSNVPLMELHDLTTGAPIPGFPGTIAQITAMQGAAVDNLLTALNLGTTGTVPQRRQRLKAHIGLLDETA